jgi:hypothetical protein
MNYAAAATTVLSSFAKMVAILALPLPLPFIGFTTGGSGVPPDVFFKRLDPFGWARVAAAAVTR